MLQTLSIARIGGFALALFLMTPSVGAAAPAAAPAPGGAPGGAPGTPAAAAGHAGQPSAPGGTTRQSAAREKAEEGLKRFGADQFLEAFQLFKEANDLFPAPTLVLYMARCQRKLGKLIEARDLYERLVAEKPPADAATAFREAHNAGKTELEALRGRIPTLKVAVKGAPGPAPTVSLLVNGLPIDPAPAQKELNPGTHTLVVTAEGAEPVVRSITLAEGASEAIDLTLRPRGAEGDSNKGGSLFPAIAAFGVGAVGLGVGGVTGAVVIGRANDLKARCQGNLCPIADKAEADAARTLGTVSTVAFAVGAAGVAAGVVLLVLRAPASEGSAANAGFLMSMKARVGVGQVSIEGRF